MQQHQQGRLCQQPPPPPLPTLSPIFKNSFSQNCKIFIYRHYNAQSAFWPSYHVLHCNVRRESKLEQKGEHTFRDTGSSADD